MKAKLDSWTMASAANGRPKPPVLRSRSLNLTSPPRASSAEPLQTRFRSHHSPEPAAAHLAELKAPKLSAPPLDTPRRQLGSGLHTKAATSKRAYRRAAPAAEQAVWESLVPQANAQLRAAADEALRDSPGERMAFATIFLLALCGICWGLNESFHFMESWDAFVSALRSMLL